MTMTDEQQQSESPFGTSTPQPVSARQVVNDWSRRACSMT